MINSNLITIGFMLSDLDTTMVFLDVDLVVVLMDLGQAVDTLDMVVENVAELT